MRAAEAFLPPPDLSLLSTHPFLFSFFGQVLPLHFGAFLHSAVLELERTVCYLVGLGGGRGGREGGSAFTYSQLLSPAPMPAELPPPPPLLPSGSSVTASGFCSVRKNKQEIICMQLVLWALTPQSYSVAPSYVSSF